MVLTERPETYNAWEYAKPYRKRFEITKTFLESKDFDKRVLHRHELMKADKELIKGPKWHNY